MDYPKVDFRFVAQQMLKEKGNKISERQMLQFRVECKDFLARTVAKLLDKSPINYRLCKKYGMSAPKANDSRERSVCQQNKKNS